MGDMEHDFLNSAKSEKNNAASHGNESDDFEQVEEYQVHPDTDDDFVQDFSANAAGLHSTDRPLVTFEENTSPSAPPAPPSLSTLPESMKYEDEDLEYERQYSQPSPKKEQKPPSYSADPEPDLIPAEKHDFSSFEAPKVDPYVAICPPAPEKIEDAMVQSIAPPNMESLPTTPPSPPRQHTPEPATSVATTNTNTNTNTNTTTTTSSDTCSCPFRAWFNPQNLDPRVVDLIYWRDPKKSGLVFGGILVLLLSLNYFSLISVVAYISLAILAVTLSFRVYKNVLAAVQKSNEGHPFKKYLDQDMVVSNDQIQEIAKAVVIHTNSVAHELRRLILVEDLVDSIKFGIMMWCLTYVGAWFNGMTLLILAFVAAFTLPKVYETHKTQIDQYVAIVQSQVNDIMSKIKAKVPIGKKAKEQ